VIHIAAQCRYRPQADHSLSTRDGIDLKGDLAIPSQQCHRLAVLLLVSDSIDQDGTIAQAHRAWFDELAAAGSVVLAMTPRPSPPGAEEQKAAFSAPFTC